MIFLALILGENEKRSIRLRRKIAERLARFLKIQVEVQGTFPEEAFVGVVNHRSYIDSVCVFKEVDACPVVKSEVARWPIIGFGLKQTATVFVERENKSSRKATRSSIAEFVKRGISTIVFVEGTTYVGPETGEFRPGTFMTAAEHALPIVPIAIEFEKEEAAWVGDDTFVPHFLSYFAKNKQTKVKVSFGPVLRHSQWDKLRYDAHQWINEELGRMQKDFKSKSD